MADVKISALPPATTPLAGTEVLPIVQSSTTKKVSVADVTAGRAISASGVTVSGLTASKPVFTDGSKALTSSGTLATDQGGTGLTSYSQGDLVYYNTGTTLTALPKNTSATRYLANTGTSNNPAWAQVDLSNGVTGTLGTANGGTGNTTGASTAVKSNATTGLMEIAGPAASSTRVMTIPNANFTAARTDAAQTFTGAQTISDGANIGGAETLKFYTYTYTLTAGNVSAGFADVTITQVTTAKVRSITTGVRIAANGYFYSYLDDRVPYGTINNIPTSTNIRLSLAASAATNDVVNIMIVEAQ